MDLCGVECPKQYYCFFKYILKSILIYHLILKDFNYYKRDNINYVQYKFAGVQRSSFREDINMVNVDI